MPRDGSGNFTLPANTQAVSGDPISSTKFNTLVQDLEADANTDRPIVAGGTGASTAAAARTNLGLVIGTDVQAFDAGLLSIAGLTTLADRSIYTTASDTYAVYTLTAAGRAILDDADAAAQRTTLGLGTAALKNTGTSGDAVPLLDAANTWAALQTFSSGIVIGPTGTSYVAGSLGFSDSNYGFIYRPPQAGAIAAHAFMSTAGTTLLQITEAGVGTILGNTVWHAGNDGAGSGLDADTLDGYNVGTSGATIPLLSGANTFSGVQGFSILSAGVLTVPVVVSNPSASASTAVSLLLRPSTTDARTAQIRAVNGGGNDITLHLEVSNGAVPSSGLTINPDTTFAFPGPSGTINGNTIWHAGNDGAGSGLDADTLDGVQGSAFATLAGTQTFTGAKDFTGGLQLSGVNVVNLSATQTLTNKTLTSPTINGGTSSTRVIASSETTGTLTVASANQTIQATGDITIPNAVFAAGDIILIYAGASSRTITEGSSVTMRLGGSSTTGSRTLAARGVAVLFFVSSSEVVVSGGAVT